MSLKGLREPAAVIVLAALMLRAIVVVLGGLPLPEPGSYRTAVAALTLSSSLPHPFPTVVLGLLVAFCVLTEPTPHARLLARFAFGWVLVTVLVSLAFGIVAVSVGAPDGGPVVRGFLLLLATLAIPGLVAVALLELVRGLGGPQGSRLGRRPGQPTGAEPEVESAAAISAKEDSGQAPTESIEDRRRQPTWHPDQAAGAAWFTAEEAARGAAAAGWGTPGEPAGWQPSPLSGEQGQGPEESSRPD